MNNYEIPSFLQRFLLCNLTLTNFHDECIFALNETDENEISFVKTM